MTARGFDSSLDSVERFHLIEIAGLQFGLLAVERVDAIVDRHVHDHSVMDAGKGSVNAVARRIVIPGTDNLLAADETVITGVLQLKAEFLHEAGNDHFIVLKQRQTTDKFGGFKSAFPQFIRSVFVNAQGNGGIVKLESADGLEDHEGDGVGGILAGITVQSTNGGVLVRVAHAGGQHEERRSTAVEAIRFEEESIDDFLRLIEGKAASGKIGVKEGPGVLVETAEGKRRITGVQAQVELIEDGSLASLPEGARGVLGTI